MPDFVPYMKTLIKSYIDPIEQKLQSKTFGEAPAELYEPIRYILSLGGKRIRPVLVLMSYSMFRDDFESILEPALAVEIFHNFTLMHDDIMDKAPLRRSKQTVHARWNENIAILSGDVMLVRAYDQLLEADDAILKQLTRRFNETASMVCEGQQYDMNFEEINDVTIPQYIHMIRLKTAVLLGFSAEMGGILGYADTDVCRLLFEFGTNIGLGFQLMDDLLDLYGASEKVGKQVGGDIIANKKTFMLLRALEKATPAQQKELQQWLQAGSFDPEEKIDAVRTIFDQLNIREETEQEMEKYFEAGMRSLDAVPANSDLKIPLIAMVNFLRKRES
jgi:geranylgeranyl diphosphate synthase type II